MTAAYLLLLLQQMGSHLGNLTSTNRRCVDMSIIRTHPRKISETPETPLAVAQNIRDTRCTRALALATCHVTVSVVYIHTAVVDQHDQKNGQKHRKYQSDSKY